MTGVLDTSGLGEAVELLVLVADLCESDPAGLDGVLGRFLGGGYGAADLGADATRLADALAGALRFADAAPEGLR